MLEAAALAALKMPNLETLEIWNRRVRSAALLRYRFEGSGCCGFGNLPFNLVSSKASKVVANTHDRENYFLLQEFLDETISVNPHTDAIKYLELFKVLRPISLHQILAAHKVRHEGLPQGFDLARPLPLAIHENPSSSAKEWSSALTYYRKITEQYHNYSDISEWARDVFVRFMRERGIEDADFEDITRFQNCYRRDERDRARTYKRIY
ncbi:hypothetical protein AB5N19_07203 [Seiridium cardinale]